MSPRKPGRRIVTGLSIAVAALLGLPLTRCRRIDELRWLSVANC
jgi:hypothetical protein